MFLIEELLFIANEKIDFYLLRKVIEFFEQEKQDNNWLLDIKIDEEEKRFIMSLYAK